MRIRSPYDETANTVVYDRLALPVQFAAPARDLVRLLKAAAGDRVLDVGSGSGAAALPASEAVTAEGMVLALDASVAMLTQLKKKRVCKAVAGSVPDLPLADETFDIVMASFVLSHFKDYRAGLAEMLRVLRPGGRLGVSAWAAGQNPYGQAWSETAQRFVPQEQHARAFREIIPWDELFSNETDLRLALEEAGLTSVEVERRTYTIELDAPDYLSLRESSVEGTLLRRNLPVSDWQRFKQDVQQVFRERFDETIRYDREVHFALGTKST